MNSGTGRELVLPFSGLGPRCFRARLFPQIGSPPITLLHGVTLLQEAKMVSAAQKVQQKESAGPSRASFSGDRKRLRASASATWGQTPGPGERLLPIAIGTSCNRSNVSGREGSSLVLMPGGERGTE